MKETRCQQNQAAETSPRPWSQQVVEKLGYQMTERGSG